MTSPSRRRWLVLLAVYVLTWHAVYFYTLATARPVNPAGHGFGFIVTLYGRDLPGMVIPFFLQQPELAAVVQVIALAVTLVVWLVWRLAD